MNESSSESVYVVPARNAAAWALAILVVALACRRLDAELPAVAALKLVLAAATVGVVPGVLTTLAWRPRIRLAALEVLGLGIAVSLALVQLVTILAVSLHVGPLVSLALLLTGPAVLAVANTRRSAGTVEVSFDDIVVVALLCLVGAFLYRLGSPVSWWEDQVHAAVARRLSALDAPRLDNLYFAPGVFYTYPFPGIHYFVAIVARLGNLDPLFVYQKLRCFWGPAALVMVHLAARAGFGGRAVGTAVTVTAALLVCNGAFAMVPGFSSGWGQLVPFSHASDVAMTVLLPALVVAAFGYLLGATTRERAFFLTTTVALTVMLTIVHIREIVQWSVYLGCLLVATLVLKGMRGHLQRAAVLVALVVAIVPTYTIWQAEVSSYVGGVVGEQQQRLVEVAQEHSWRDLIVGAAPTVLEGFVPNAALTFGGLIPLGLLAAPVVLVVFRRRVLSWFAVPSIGLYLAIMSAPLLAFAYIYATYFEILYSPVRNVVWFAYLFAGALVYVATVALVRVDRTRLTLPIAGFAAGVLGVLATSCLNQSGAGFFLPLIVACAGAALLAADEGVVGPRKAMVAVALAVAGAVALWPERQPVAPSARVGVEWAAGVSDGERVALEQQFHLADGERESGNREAWRYRLMDVSTENVRALVTHPQAAETAQIDRGRFSVSWELPPDADDPPLGAQLVTALMFPSQWMFIASAVAAWALAFLAPLWLASAAGQSTVAVIGAALATPFRTHAVPYALFMIPFLVLTARPEQSPMFSDVRPSGGSTPSATLANLPCVDLDRRPAPFVEDLSLDSPVELPALKACMPSANVIAWLRDHLPVEAVIATNRWNPVFLPLVVPQQIAAFPGTDRTLEQERALFGEYYRFYADRMRAHRVQPFFNAVETPTERAAFLSALGVTHVVLDPASFDEIRPVLDGRPDLFTRQYVGDGWAVYGVRGAALGSVGQGE